MFDFDEIEEFVEQNGPRSWAESPTKDVCWQDDCLDKHNQSSHNVPEMFDFDEIENFINQMGPCSWEERKERCTRMWTGEAFTREQRMRDNVEVNVVLLSGESLASFSAHYSWTFARTKRAIELISPKLSHVNLRLAYGSQIVDDERTLGDLHISLECPVLLHAIVVTHASVAQDFISTLHDSASSLRRRISAVADLAELSCLPPESEPQASDDKQNAWLGLISNELVDVVVNESEDFAVRAAAAEALGRLRNPHHISLLARILDDPSDSWQLRRAAALALGGFGEEGVPPLARFLEHTNADVQQLTSEALARVGPSLALHLVDYMNHSRSDVRQFALSTWAGVGAKNDRINLAQSIMEPIDKALEACLEDAWMPVHSAALEACTQTRNAKVLCACLGSNTSSLKHKRGVQKALSLLGSPIAEYVSPLLNSSIWYTRYFAISLLLELPDADSILLPNVVDMIRSLVYDPQTQVAAEAKRFFLTWSHKGIPFRIGSGALPITDIFVFEPMADP